MKNGLITCLLLSAFAFTGSAQPWYQISVPTSANLNDIEFASDLVGYIAGDSATLLKTTDGGETWEKLSPTWDGFPFGNVNLLDVNFINESLGYMATTSSAGILKTTDGGLTWTVVPNNTTNQCYTDFVYVFAEDDLMVGGSDCFQGTTITQYQDPNWSVMTVNYANGNTDEIVTQIEFEGNLGLAAVNNEFMLRSTDFGQTWDTLSVGLAPGGVLTSVMIASNDTIYAGYDQNGGGFGIIISTDNGLTWTQDFSSATFYYPAFFGLCESSDGSIYVGARPSGGQDGLIFELSNGTWSFYPVDHTIYALDSYGADVTFGVGSNGYVVVNQLIANVGMEELSIVEEQLVIAPNPASDLVKVSSTLGAIEWIDVIDLQGMHVMHTQIGSTNGMLNVSELATGIYFIHTELNGLRQVGRLVKQ